MFREFGKSLDWRQIAESLNERRMHMSEESAFRPCGRDLAEFFKSTGWALYVNVAPEQAKFL